MEREHNPNQFFEIKNGKETLRCTPNNTWAWLYENPEHDHIFHGTEETEDGWNGYHIFRGENNSGPLGEQFDGLIRRMILTGFEVTNEDEISESDLMAYRRFTGEPDPDCLIQYRELGPTLDRKVANWGKFLQTVEVTVEDFA